MKFTSHNAQETQAVAAEFAATLHGGETVVLIGDLGAGKTTFVQGLAAALGVTARVKSPTFTVMNEYAGGSLRLLHLDLYRFTDATELRALALEDERRPDTVVLIEWPNAIDHDFMADVVVTIDHAGGDGRVISIERS
ncbi:MAG: tRNA (adenosine(37)-N6)-threonylcarbamoyltransferase complex ATPase subunit type 1 TsaE [Patescibacteria group bacterium]